FSTGSAYRQVLVDVLLRDYSREHDVILYEAATLPIQEPKTIRLKLGELPNAIFSMHATLVIPPIATMEPALEVLERLSALDSTTKEIA
ncbi:MAG TPA: hypothetical protein VNA21_04215, partial [Steroidobacteraceae bacterium]|nr:hypothetical protein [Steroidobacteraceae bacterium]